MPISLTTVDDLQEHLLGVFERSAHHAGEVNEVLLALSGAILWRKRPGDPVKVNTKEGAGGNVIWFRVDGTRYALLYDHDARHIELRESGRKGALLHTFTNATPTSVVSEVFAGLGGSVPSLAAARKERKPGKEHLSKPERHAMRAERAERLQRKAERIAAKATPTAAQATAGVDDTAPPASPDEVVVRPDRAGKAEKLAQRAAKAARKVKHKPEPELAPGG
jgi:hypothetical protein